MIQTGDVKFDALVAELQAQLVLLSEGKAMYAVRIAELELLVKQAEEKIKDIEMATPVTDPSSA